MEKLSNHVQTALKEVICNSGIKDYKIKLLLVSNKGDNYLGTLYRVEVLGLNYENESKLYLICKVPPPLTKLEDFRAVHVPYEREIYIYNVILRHFDRLQCSKNLTESEKFTSFAVCHTASDELRSEFLILEDLVASSYVMFDKNKQLDSDHISLVIKGLAKFHALSFAMRDQEPEEFHKITQIDSTMYDGWGKQAFVDIGEFGLKQTMDVLEESNMQILYNKVKNIKDNCEEIMDNAFYAVGSENYRVIAHGDCWNNNFMFKYKNGIPTEICFIDWQMSRFVSPVLDLLYFLYLSCENDMLNTYYDSFIDLYYKQLKESVKKLESDLDKLYPYEMFQNDFKKFGNFGIVHCSFALNFTFANTENAPDVEGLSNAKGAKESLQDCLGFKDDSTKKRYAERMRNVVQHAAKRHYI